MSSAVLTFAVLNFILAGLSLFGSGFSLVLMLSVGNDSQATDEEKFVGMCLYGFLALVILVYALGHLVAGVGLLKRKRWGYFTHLVMAGLAIFNCGCCCLGFIYTIPALIIGFQDDVRREFGLEEKTSG